MSISKTAWDDAWRNNVTAGVPESGVNHPSKEAIRALIGPSGGGETVTPSDDWVSIIEGAPDNYTITFADGDYSMDDDTTIAVYGKNEVTLLAESVGGVTMDAAFTVVGSEQFRLTAIDLYRPTDSNLIDRDFFDVQGSFVDLDDCIVTEAYGDTRLVIGRSGARVQLSTDTRNGEWHFEDSTAGNWIDAEDATSITIRGERSAPVPETFRRIHEIYAGINMAQVVAVKLGAGYLRNFYIHGHASGSVGAYANNIGVWAGRGASITIDLDNVLGSDRCGIEKCHYGVMASDGGVISFKVELEDTDDVNEGIFLITDCDIAIRRNNGWFSGNMTWIDTSGCTYRYEGHGDTTTDQWWGQDTPLPLTWAQKHNKIRKGEMIRFTDVGADGTLMIGDGTRYKAASGSAVLKALGSSLTVTAEAIVIQTLFPAAFLRNDDCLEIRVVAGKSGVVDSATMRVRAGAVGDLTDDIVVEDAAFPATASRGDTAIFEIRRVGATQLRPFYAGGYSNSQTASFAAAVTVDSMDAAPFYVSITLERVGSTDTVQAHIASITLRTATA